MLSDAVVIITGASSGIGRATALKLAESGCCLSLLARSETALRQVADEAAARGARGVLCCVCDVREADAVDQAAGQTLARFGQIDILINSAGLSLNGAVDGYSLTDWQTVIDTNLTGTFLTCRAVLPAMKQQGGGQIINISSGAGRNGIRNMAAYCAAKFGVIGFTESLALEVRNQNIRVSALLPGSTATDFARTANRAAPIRARDEHRSETGYAMTSDEVASVIAAMLVQPSQAWMSEVVLRPLNLELRRPLVTDQ